MGKQKVIINNSQPVEFPYKNASGIISSVIRGGLSRTLLLWFLGISLIPLFVVSIINYQIAYKSLRSDADEQLKIVSQNKKNEIQAFFSDKIKDLLLYTDRNSTRQMLLDFRNTYSVSGLTLSDFVKSPDWNMLVQQYGRESKSFNNTFGNYDLLMIDAEGNILYSVKKENDLGINIFSGKYAGTKFSEACQRALKTGAPVFSDFEKYAPSNNDVAGFIVNVVLGEKGEKLGLMAVQLSIRQIDKIMQDRNGLDQDGETYLVGTDFKMRSNSILEKESTALGKPVETEQEKLWYQGYVEGDPTVQGADMVTVHTDRRGVPVLGIHRALEVAGVKMAVIATIDEAEALRAASEQRNTAIVLGFFTTLFVLFAAFLITRRIVKPVQRLSAWVEQVAVGDLSYIEITSPENEIGQMEKNFREVVNSLRILAAECENIAIGDLKQPVQVRSKKDQLGKSLQQMLDTLLNVERQANAIAKGDYSVKVVPRSEKDELGIALANMTNTLRKVTADNEEINWLRIGITRLHEQVSGEQEEAVLAQKIISFLADYLKAQVGGIYLLNKSGVLRLVGSYAYTKRKNLSNEFKLGEGLVGQAALEKKSILVTNIPDDYVKITSGLGDGIPRCILVIPFFFEEKLQGVIELGTFHEFTDIQLDFLNRAVLNIAIALDSAQSRDRMRQLLEETQRQAEELQSQQEELRQANEDLEEQAHSLKESEARLQSQQEELRQINEELQEKNRALEKQKYDIQNKNAELDEARRLIEEKVKDLELTSKYKSEFLANISHELRTPLNSLLLLSKLLVDNKEGNLTEKQVEFAQTIHSAGTDLLNLINDVLDLSKVEAGKIELNIEKVSIDELAFDIERNFRPLAEERGLSFKIELASGLSQSIRTDRQRVEQILKNLLSNAFKFTREGSIKLNICCPRSGIDFKKDGLKSQGVIAFAVADTGIGIPPDKQKLIFEAFKQADGTTSRQYGGTGLGLSISRRLAELLGGEIKLQSQEGVGSTFTLYLPQKLPVEQGEQSVFHEVEHNLKLRPQVNAFLLEDNPPVSSHEKSVLIIEDDQNFIKILEELSHEKGFHSLVARDGEAGLQLAADCKPSAIILDIGLPGIDGWTVMEKLKDSPVTRHIPVHFISAYDNSLDAMKMGAIGYLVKPVSMEKLDLAFQKIEKVISKSIKKLLVVEDDEPQRKAILELVGKENVIVKAVGAGQDAYSLLKDEVFDCLVLDLGLEDMSGFELLEKIRNEQTISHIPVIVYTGKELSRQEEAKLREYAESIIIKGAKSPERLMDEVALFLHSVEVNMIQKKHTALKVIHDKETIFQDKKILIVDDDMRNVFALLHVFEEKGVKVIVGKNGKEGLECLNSDPDIDLVLMDIMMPEMDGYQAMREIRKQKKFSNLPIIALTAKAMKGDKNKCIEAGASDYLPKPIDIDKLLSLLRVWLYR